MGVKLTKLLKAWDSKVGITLIVKSRARLQPCSGWLTILTKRVQQFFIQYYIFWYYKKIHYSLRQYVWQVKAWLWHHWLLRYPLECAPLCTSVNISPHNKSVCLRLNRLGIYHRIIKYRFITDTAIYQRRVYVTLTINLLHMMDELTSLSTAVCGMKQWQIAISYYSKKPCHERYKLYTTRCDLHRDFARQKAEWNLYMN